MSKLLRLVQFTGNRRFFSRMKHQGRSQSRWLIILWQFRILRANWEYLRKVFFGMWHQELQLRHIFLNLLVFRQLPQCQGKIGLRQWQSIHTTDIVARFYWVYLFLWLLFELLVELYVLIVSGGKILWCVTDISRKINDEAFFLGMLELPNYPLQFWGFSREHGPDYEIDTAFNCLHR